MGYAFFDFDGTVTRRDSFFGFLLFAVGWKKLLYGSIMLLPLLLRYKLCFVTNEYAKQRVLRYFFYGMPCKEFDYLAKSYSLEKMDDIVRSRAMQKILWHKEQGHVVAIVSASAENWLRPWCEIHELDLIGTQLESQSGLITGSIAGKNCFGVEKVRRINQCYGNLSHASVYAYGDSEGDREMLKFAGASFYKPFR